MKNLLRYGSSFFAPVVICLVLPYFIVRYEHRSSPGPWLNHSLALLVLGLLVTAGGFVLFVITARMFILIGQGTIMPWDPTRKLIVTGVYRYVRNPMILAVLTIEVGEALLFGSLGIALVAIFFFVVNTVYFVFSEEPGLEKRFGQEYVAYKKNVPRWIPRRKPWQPYG